MEKKHSKIKNIRTSIILILLALSIVFLPKWRKNILPAEASGSTFTVCASLCNFTNIHDAFLAAGAGDTIQIGSTYNPATEKFSSYGNNSTSDLADFTADGQTLNCQGNTIGNVSTSVFLMGTAFNSSTIENCTIANIFLNVKNGSHVSGFSVLNNIFDRNTTTSISFGTLYANNSAIDTYVSNFAVNGNTDINVLAPGGVLNNGTINNNTFYTHVKGAIQLDGPLIFAFAEIVTNVSVVSNTFDFLHTDSNAEFNLNGKNFLFASNTIKFSAPLGSPASLVQIGITPDTSVYIRNNIFDFSNLSSQINLFNIGPQYAVDDLGNSGGLLGYPSFVYSREPIHGDVLIDHNSIIFGPNAQNSTIITISDNTTSTQNDTFAHVTSTYNIFYNPSSDKMNRPYYISRTQAGGGNATIFSDYNGIYGFSSDGVVNTTGVPSQGEILFGGNDLHIRPMFETDDSVTANNYTLAPFSNYLDVNGTEDVGAVTGTRRNTIAINSAGTINYTATDATNTYYLNEYVRSGDTISFATGRYDSFSVSSTAATTTVTISGQGSNSIINASTTPVFRNLNNFTLSNLLFNLYASSSLPEVSFDAASKPVYGVLIDNLATSTFNNLQFYGLVSSTCDVFVSSSVNLTFTSSTFSKGAPVTANTPNLYLNKVSSSTFQNITTQGASSSAFVYTMTRAVYSFGGHNYNDDTGSGPDVPTVFGPGFQNASITTDGTNITGQLADGVSDIHLALVRIDGFGGLRGTFFIPNSVYPDQASLEAAVAGFGGHAELWVTSTFSVDTSNNYTYNSALVATKGATLNNGLTSPPRITTGFTSPGSIKLYNSSNNLFESVTSTLNGIGLWLSGNSANNNVSSSVFVGNTPFDILSDSSGSNNFKNSTFNTASTSVSGLGALRVYVKTRAFVTATSTAPISNVPVTFTSADTSQTMTLTSGVDGYTPYSDYLLSFIMDSNSVATTNGGYNPYTVSAPKVGAYEAYSAATSLTTRNQTVSTILNLTLATPKDTTADATTHPAPGGWYNQPPDQNTPPNTLPINQSTTSEGSAQTSSTTPVGISAQAVTSTPTSTVQVVPPTNPIAKSDTFLRNLTVGSIGPDVSLLQMVLKNLSLFTYYTFTNNFGGFTKVAVQRLQKNNHLKVTGSLDTATRASVNALVAKKPSLVSPPLYKFTTFMKLGDKNANITQLQKRLSELGYYTGTVTGSFDAATKAAVIKLQIDHKLKPLAGYVGPGTRAVLNATQ